MELSYQLYSSRNFALEDTLAALAAQGIKNVEGFGGLYGEADKLAAMLKEHGLVMPSGHFGVLELENDFDAMMKVADTLGVEYIIAPYLDVAMRPKTKAGWQEFGQRLAKIADKIVATGRRFAWHNHEFEFAPFPDNSLPIDAILGASDNIHAELDLAWIRVQNRDPADELSRLKDRAICVHIKDIAPMGENSDQDGWANVGEGIMDWEALSLVLPETDVKYGVLEHDNPKDPIAFINKSAPFAKNI